MKNQEKPSVSWFTLGRRTCVDETAMSASLPSRPDRCVSTVRRLPPRSGTCKAHTPRSLGCCPCAASGQRNEDARRAAQRDEFAALELIELHLPTKPEPTIGYRTTRDQS